MPSSAAEPAVTQRIEIAKMVDSLATLEAEITAAGHELERSYEFGGQDARDGAG